jgi:hypothetical protein
MSEMNLKVTYQDLFDYLKQRIDAEDDQWEEGMPPADWAIDFVFTKEFAKKHGLFWGELLQTLEDRGYCSDEDLLCFAVLQIPGHEIIGQESFKTPREIATEKGLYCHPQVNGKPVSPHEAFEAQEAGVPHEWDVPCTKDAPYARLDIDRARRFM